MRNEVYSWRLSRELKTELETEARRRKVSLSALLESLAREGLAHQGSRADEAEQSKLHAEANRWIGSIAVGFPGGSESARDLVRQKLIRKHERSRAH
jgi:hypothetical protein